MSTARVARAPGLVGRDRERTALLETLDAGGPLTVFVHGPAGVGKSALLQAFIQDAQQRGARIVRLDSRGVEPTARGFLDALGASLGEPVETVHDAARALGATKPTILALDTYEVFRISDTWLSQTFAPALPDSTRLVVAGREPPVSGWLSARGGAETFRGVLLGPLSEADAHDLLRAIGFGEREARAVNRVARGHPLALHVAGLALRERPQRTVEEAAIPRVVDELITLYLDGVDPSTRRVLDAASCLRRVTIPLLEAMLPEIDASGAVQTLRALPFVEDAPDGLRLHEAIQAAIAARLEAVDPDAQRRYRAAAWKHLRGGMRAATRAELWRYTSDMLYLLQNPVIREAFFPTTQHLYSLEQARREDEEPLFAIIDRHEPPEAAMVLRVWWHSLPEAFRTIRDRSGAVVGVSILARGDRIPARIVKADPVVAAWREHLHRHPPAYGAREILFDRRALDRDAGEAPSPTQAVEWLDVKRLYMEMRPNLARLYTVVADPTPYLDALVTLGFSPFPEPVHLGGDYHMACLDFGPGSVDGWLARLAATEIGVAEDGVLDPVNRELVVDGARVSLTPLEFGVMELLVRNAGQTVKRLTLLEQVWGHRYEGGSNVVDVVVRALRKKLGPAAGAIETVRGLGYRYTGAR